MMMRWRWTASDHQQQFYSTTSIIYTWTEHKNGRAAESTASAMPKRQCDRRCNSNCCCFVCWHREEDNDPVCPLMDRRSSTTNCLYKGVLIAAPMNPLLFLIGNNIMSIDDQVLINCSPRSVCLQCIDNIQYWKWKSVVVYGRTNCNCWGVLSDNYFVVSRTVFLSFNSIETVWLAPSSSLLATMRRLKTGSALTRIMKMVMTRRREQLLSKNSMLVGCGGLKEKQFCLLVLSGCLERV